MSFFTVEKYLSALQFRDIEHGDCTLKSSIENDWVISKYVESICYY